jgi:hypothetical protein
MYADSIEQGGVAPLFVLAGRLGILVRVHGFRVSVSRYAFARNDKSFHRHSGRAAKRREPESIDAAELVCRSGAREGAVHGEFGRTGGRKLPRASFRIEEQT